VSDEENSLAGELPKVTFRAADPSLSHVILGFVIVLSGELAVPCTRNPL